MPVNFDAIILGAGAAGLMCAARAGARGRSVLVVDHAESVGKKILISGGGRCNFTNVGAVAERFISKNPHFAKSALGRFTPQDFIAMVDDFQIAWHEKTLGQLFCDGSSRQIVDMLVCACTMPTVTITTCMSVTEISHHDGMFDLVIGGKRYQCASLVIATGGPSIPKMGASGFAYEIARQFGLKVIEPRPALVPLTLGGEEILFRELSGVAAPTRVRCGKTRFDEASLFTHRGLSGPAILQISSYWRHGDNIGIDFLPGEDATALLLAAKRASPKSTVRAQLAGHLPARLAEALAERLNGRGNLADTPDRWLSDAGAQLNDWTFTPNGTEGFAKAEVTIGGIDTDGLNQTTLAAKHLPGLFAIGEAVDVTGWLGGYNFQWAWASGAAAGEAV
ncbi:MAG: NAD(P)/FAD-dependent oxidoreductase [Sphingomonadaceae bacterium]